MAADTEAPAKFGGFVRGRELGRGASGIVFACQREDDSTQTFAAKAIDLRRLELSARADREFKKLRREVDILKRMPTHPNLVRCMDALEEGDWFFFILEFVGGGNLFNSLTRRRSERGKKAFFLEPEAAFVGQQLLEGLAFLHDHAVIHRDLKLENVLVSREWTEGPSKLCEVKIADFGLSKVVGDGLSDARSTVGTARYIAPEVMRRGIHDFRADLWSLGILLYVLLAGCFPTDDPPKVSQEEIDEAIDKLDVGQDAKTFLLGLLQVERELRVALKVLRTYAWLTQRSNSDEAENAAKRPRLELISTKSLFGSEDNATTAQAAVRSPMLAQGKTPVVMPPPNVAAKSVIIVPPVVRPPPNVAAKPMAPVVMPPSVVPSSASPFAPSPGGQPVCNSTTVASVKDLDCNGGDHAVQGTVVFRCDHKTGGGFHVRLRDETGEIDVRFWDQAAEKFRGDPALCKGAVVRVAGFHKIPLREKDVRFAPPGRQHHLNFNLAESVRLRLVEAVPT